MNQWPSLAIWHSACAVRRAQANDCVRMAALAAQLGYECTGEDVRGRLSEMQDSKQYAVYVAELPGRQVVGWIGVYVFRAVESATSAEISGLVVDEALRSGGIGKILLDAAEKWARQVGCNAISVHSNVTRNRAHQFYTNNGYRPVKTQKIFHKSL